MRRKTVNCGTVQRGRPGRARMDQRMPGPAREERSLSSALKAVFAAASIPTAAVATPLSVYIPNYYASHLALPLAVVGGVVALVRLIDLGFDLLIGIAINATRTPFGRFRPWMMAGAPVLAASVYAIFMAERSEERRVGKEGRAGWALYR